MGCNRSCPCGAKSVGQEPGQHRPIDQCIAQTAGRIREVAYDAPGTVGGASDVERIVHQPSWRGKAGGVRSERRKCVQQRGRHDPIAHELPLAGGVDKQRFQQTHSLDGGIGQHRELCRIEDVRQWVQAPRSALHPCGKWHTMAVSATVERKLVHQVPSTFGVQQPIRIALTVV